MNKALALIVEDEYDISVIFEKALEAAGFETEAIRSGDAAMTWLSSQTPDVVVLDLHLPGVAGGEILHHIRTEPRLAKVQVIVATAFQHLAEGLHDEADWVFLKPVGFSELRDLATRLGAGAPADEAPHPKPRS